MKKQFIFLLYFLSTSLFSFTQRLDLDRFNFTFKNRSLPANPLPNDLKTYYLRVRNNSGLGRSESDIAESIILEGFRKNPNGKGDILLELSLGGLFFEGSTIRSRKDEKKDKDGKITSTTYYYWVEAPYSYEANGRVYDEKASGNAFISENYNRRSFYKSPESTNEKGVNEEFLRRRDEIRRNMLNDFTNETIRKFTESINAQVGYPILTSRPNFWVTDSPKHPENEKHKEMCALAARVIERFRGDATLGAEVAKELFPAIDYFKNISNNYKSSDKNDKKLRYSAYYNLMWIYYCIDDLDSAVKFADLLIANDFDSSDGKSMIRNVEILREQFHRNNFKTRQFGRDEDMRRIYVR